MTEKKGWFSKIKEGLFKTSSTLTENLTAVIKKKKLDAETLDELEELLIASDMGVSMSAKVIEKLRSTRFDQEIELDQLKEFLADEIAALMEPYCQPLDVASKHDHPKTILVIGVNGGGKTTTIAKLAHYWKTQGLKVRLIAADTFRAAAVEQLKVWAERAKVPVISGALNTDPAGLIYDGMNQSFGAGDDVLLIDTAGRLQNKEHLMAELEKIVRVMQKHTQSAPDACVLVLDATVGQNALSQVLLFQEVAPITGLILTKLDGTAKGGILVNVADKFKLPIHAIGVGEGIDDLQPFHAKDYARNLVGLKE